MTLPKITGAVATSLTIFGGEYLNTLTDLFSGVNIAAADPTNVIKIGTSWTFKNQVLKVESGDATPKAVTIQGPSSIDVAKNIRLPTMDVGNDSDLFLLANTIQPFIGKTIDLSVNLLSETGKSVGAILVYDGTEYTGLPRGTANQVLMVNPAGTGLIWGSPSTSLPSTVVQTNQANTYGAFRQEFRSSNLIVSRQDGNMTNGVRIAGPATQTGEGAVSFPNNVVAGANFALDNYTNLFTANQWHNNNVTLYWKDSGGTLRQTLKVGPTDVIQLGDTVGVAGIILVPGASTALSITSANLVTISPQWSVPLILSNNVPIYEKAADGTTSLQVIKVDGSNNLIYGGGATFANMYLFSGAATAALQLTNTNQALFTKMAQAGVAEVVAKWLVSDDAASFIQIENAFTTDLFFGPVLKFYSAGTASSGNNLIAQITAANDTGTNPAFIISSRLNTGAQLATRPLLDIQNFTTSVFKLNAKGDTVNTTIAQAGVTEPLEQWGVSDNAGFIKLSNNTTSDGIFGGQLDTTLATNSTTATVAMIHVARILAANDGGSNPIFSFQVKTTAFGDIVTRPLYDFINNATLVLRVNPKGDLTQAILASAPANPSAGYASIYPKTINANNEAYFYKTKVNGSIQEVRI